MSSGWYAPTFCLPFKDNSIHLWRTYWHKQNIWISVYVAVTHTHYCKDMMKFSIVWYRVTVIGVYRSPNGYWHCQFWQSHYSDVIMGTMASQINSLIIVYSTFYSGVDQRKHQSSASLAFVRGIHRWPVNSPHKWPVTRKMFPIDDVIMVYLALHKVIRITLRNLNVMSSGWLNSWWYIIWMNHSQCSLSSRSLKIIKWTKQGQLCVM